MKKAMEKSLSRLKGESLPAAVATWKTQLILKPVDTVDLYYLHRQVSYMSLHERNPLIHPKSCTAPTLLFQSRRLSVRWPNSSSAYLDSVNHLTD